MHWLVLICIATITIVWIYYLIQTVPPKGDQGMYYYRPDIVNYIGASALVGIVLLSFIACWIAIYDGSCESVEELKAARATIEKARQGLNVAKYERYGLVETLIENNQKLAELQYQNQHWFMYSAITDQVDELEPLK